MYACKQEERELKKGKMAELAKKAARRAALAARDKSAAKRVSSARGSPDADASGPVKTVTPVKRRRAKTGAAARPEDGSDKDESRAAPDADLLLDGSSDKMGAGRWRWGHRASACGFGPCSAAAKRRARVLQCRGSTVLQQQGSRLRTRLRSGSYRRSAAAFRPSWKQSRKRRRPW